MRAAFKQACLTDGIRLRRRRGHQVLRHAGTGVEVELTRGGVAVEAPLSALLTGVPGDDGLADPEHVPVGARAVVGLLRRLGLPLDPAAAPRVARVDVAVDLLFPSRTDGLAVLAALGSLDLPQAKRCLYPANGSSALESVYWRQKAGTVGRAYDRSERAQEAGSAPAGGLVIRLEAQQRYKGAARPAADALAPADVAGIFAQRFGAVAPEAVHGGGSAVARALAERVLAGELKPGHAAKMLGYAQLLATFGDEIATSPRAAGELRRELRRLGIPIDAAALDALGAVPIGHVVSAACGAVQHDSNPRIPTTPSPAQEA